MDQNLLKKLIEERYWHNQYRKKWFLVDPLNANNGNMPWLANVNKKTREAKELQELNERICIPERKKEREMPVFWRSLCNPRSSYY